MPSEKRRKKERKIALTRVPEFRTYYANNVGLGVSPWDFNFTFGRVKKANQNALEIDELCEVYLSPEHALVFLRALVERLKFYRDSYGAIREFEQGKPIQASVIASRRRLASANEPMPSREKPPSNQKH